MIQTSLFTFTIRSRIKISPTSTGQTKAVWMNFLTLSSRLATARRDLASNSDKKPKNRRKFAKKIRLKNREILQNRIKLLLFTFENRRKIKEKSALFGGPYRNSHRQFFYSPIRRAWAISTGFFLDFCTKVKEESGARGADLYLFENARNHAKSRTTAENIAYRTNHWPVEAQDFAPTACNPTISKILLPVVNFTERKRIKSRTRFGAKSTQNLKVCMKNTHFLIAIFNILAPFWHCKVIPYRGEKLSLLLHTSETRSLPRIAVKRWIAKRAKMRKDAQRRPKTRKQKNFKTFFWRLAKLTEELAGGRVGYRKTHKIQTLNPILAYLKYFWY